MRLLAVFLCVICVFVCYLFCVFSDGVFSLECFPARQISFRIRP